MYRKGLLSLIFGMCFLGISSIQAQAPTSQLKSTSNPKDCTSINDVVDREICMAQVAVEQCDAALTTKSLSKEDQAYWLQIRTSQVEKIKRFKSLTAAERKNLQDHFELMEKARKASSNH